MEGGGAGPGRFRSSPTPHSRPRAPWEQLAGGCLPVAAPGTPVSPPARPPTPAAQVLTTWANTSSHGPGLSPPRISRETQLSKKVATVANCSAELRQLP